MCDDDSQEKRIGRPRTLTPELEQPILDGIAGGLSVKEACRRAGVSYDSYRRKWGADEAFRSRLARAYLHGTVFFLSNAEDRLERATNKTIAVDREYALHARWRSSRLIPAFSEKLAVGITDETGFFGSQAPPVKRPSWRGKPIGEWDSNEQIDFMQAHNMYLVALGVDLVAIGFPPIIREALTAVVDALQRHIDHPTVATLALLLLRGEN